MERSVTFSCLCWGSFAPVVANQLVQLVRLPTPVYYLGELLQDMVVGRSTTHDVIVGGVRVMVAGAPMVEAGSNYPDEDDESVTGGYLPVRIEAAKDDSERDFSKLVQKIIVNGLRDYATAQPSK